MNRNNNTNCNNNTSNNNSLRCNQSAQQQQQREGEREHATLLLGESAAQTGIARTDKHTCKHTLREQRRRSALSCLRSPSTKLALATARGRKRTRERSSSRGCVAADVASLDSKERALINCCLAIGQTSKQRRRQRRWHRQRLHTAFALRLLFPSRFL